MSRSRLDTMIGTAVLATIVLVGFTLSNLVPSPYRETAVVVDPIMDRLPVTAVESEAGEETTVTLTGARAHREDDSRYVN